MSKTGSEKSCIVIDVGNTSTSIGRYCCGRVENIIPVKGGIAKTAEVIAALRAVASATVDAAALSSVVPAVNTHWVALVKELLGLDLMVLSSSTPLPIAVRYPKPEQIGADRLCDAVAAVARHGYPVAVADFGTALTFDVVDCTGAYIGGLIAPGLPLMTGYLHEKTAQLPAVDLSADLPTWGDSTEHAMQLGAKYGHRGMVREIISFIRSKTGDNTCFCATGGYAAWALDGLTECSIEPDLTLFGLGKIWEWAQTHSA